MLRVRLLPADPNRPTLAQLYQQQKPQEQGFVTALRTPKTAGQVQSRPSSRVRSPGSFTDAVGLRLQTALTGSAWAGQYLDREHTCSR